MSSHKTDWVRLYQPREKVMSSQEWWLKQKADLEKVGGWNNSLMGVPAGGVKELIIAGIDQTDRIAKLQGALEMANNTNKRRGDHIAQLEAERDEWKEKCKSAARYWKAENFTALEAVIAEMDLKQ